MGTYDTIFSVYRRRPSNRGEMTVLEAAESDRSRVIYCAALRRMQKKRRSSLWKKMRLSEQD